MLAADNLIAFLKSGRPITGLDVSHRDLDKMLAMPVVFGLAVVDKEGGLALAIKSRPVGLQYGQI